MFTKYHELIPQTALKHPFNKYGCNMRVLQAIAEIEAETLLTKEQIEMLGDIYIDKKYIDKEVTVEKPEDIIASVFAFMGSKKRAWNSGVLIDGQFKNWAGKYTEYFDYIILKLYQEDRTKEHFVLADSSVKVIFDPTPNSRSYRLWLETGCDIKAIKKGYLYKIIGG